MATQSFIPEMQAITPGNVQTPSAQQPSSQPPPPPQQPQPTTQPQQQPTQQSQQVAGGSGSDQTNAGQAPQQPQGNGQTANIVLSAQQSQQFITVAVSEDENTEHDSVTLQNASQAVHSTYVQASYPVYCTTETNTMYTPATAYYNTGNSTAVTYSQVSSALPHAAVGLQGQILTHQGGGTYLVQGGGMEGDGHALAHTAARASPQTDGGGVAYLVQGSSVDGDGHQLSHATRVSPATVHWLLDNYETAEGVSLPRSTLYNHYLRHCTEHKLDPVNAASFGKLIRSVFLGLRTRRLGTRGNSKYHYYGIRVKPNSPLNQMSEDVVAMALRQQPVGSGKRIKGPITHKSESQDGSQNPCAQSQTSSSSSDSTSPQQQQHQQYLGDATGAIPNFADIDVGGISLPDGLCLDDIHVFKVLYKEHYEAFLDAVVNLHFSLVETLWQEFWRSSHSISDHITQRSVEMEKQLPKSKLVLICKCEALQQFVRRGDYQFYQNLVDVLIPDVLRPIPSSLTQAIRNFAKSLEGWLTSAMLDTPDEMLKIKVSAVSAFAQTLRRYTSLNHLAQAARAVLQNSAQINQMLADLNRVDFYNVQEQASWVCQCEDGLVQKLEQDFKLTLQQQNSLEQWAAWLEGVVAQVLKPHEGKADFAKAARQFLLKWSFYSSMVIRDLTLRSAASFGSFHLIRLLYDEYMFYLIEHRVAVAMGETPIAVMGEYIGVEHKMMLKEVKGGATSNGNNHNNHSGSMGQKMMMLNASGPMATTSKRLKTN